MENVSQYSLYVFFNPLNAELNPICHLLALLGGATIIVVSRLRVKQRHLHFARTFATLQTQNLKFPFIKQENSAKRVSNSLFQFIKRSWFRWIDLFGPTARFEVLSVVTVNIQVFCDVTSCRLTNIHRNFVES